MNLRKERRRVSKGGGGGEEAIEKGGYEKGKREEKEREERGMHVVLCYVMNELKGKHRRNISCVHLSSDERRTWRWDPRLCACE